MPIKPFTLQLPAAELPQYAAAFSYQRNPSSAIAAGLAAAEAGYYTKAGVLDVVDWKSARTKVRVVSSDATIRETTAQAFAAQDELTRMEALTTLPGVGVPVASALLLFALGDTYPILDVNALASLDHRGRGKYPASFWIRYLGFVRELATQQGISPRSVEKALWEFEKQRKANC